jgi:hypothetical protein
LVARVLEDGLRGSLQRGRDLLEGSPVGEQLLAADRIVRGVGEASRPETV